MKTNENLQRDVLNAIKWEPLLKAAEIGVIAKDGVVTLTGTVDSYAKKSEAEDAAKNVAGVKAVVEAIAINLGTSFQNSDAEIAKEVINGLKQNWVPDNKVKIKIENGWVTLEGALQWNFQKEAANKAVKNLPGILGLTNDIRIRPETHDEIEKKDIEYALARNWSIENHEIEVKVTGTRVTLRGKVNSLYEKNEADRIAWNAPGVCVVDNELLVE